MEIKNTFGVKANAREYIEYASEDELRAALPRLKGQRVLHVGGGSNILFTGDFDGVVLHSAIRGIDVVEDHADTLLVRVGAGTVWDDFVAHSVAQGWSGVENLSLIPGEVGASAVQNIGAYGVEAKDVIHLVEAIDLTTGDVREFQNADCHYAYRQSIFKQELKGRYAITHVTYALSKHFVPHLDYGNIRSELADTTCVTPQQVREVIIRIRQQKLPDTTVQGNAGSFFMNPVVNREKFESLLAQYPQMPYYDVPDGVKIPAGWMIEQCGWKGKSIGPAAVHERQALVLVNLGGATGADILRLSDAVCKSVEEKFGIDIHPEVNVI